MKTALRSWFAVAFYAAFAGLVSVILTGPVSYVAPAGSSAKEAALIVFHVGLPLLIIGVVTLLITFVIAFFAANAETRYGIVRLEGQYAYLVYPKKEAS